MNSMIFKPSVIPTFNIYLDYDILTIFYNLFVVLKEMNYVGTIIIKQRNSHEMNEICSKKRRSKIAFLCFTFHHTEN